MTILLQKRAAVIVALLFNGFMQLAVCRLCWLVRQDLCTCFVLHSIQCSSVSNHCDDASEMMPA